MPIKCGIRDLKKLIGYTYLLYINYELPSLLLYYNPQTHILSEILSYTGKLA